MTNLNKAALRNKLQEVKLSIVLSDLWTDTDSRLGEVFMIPKKGFAEFSVMTVADFLQLLPIGRKLMFSQFSNKNNMKNFIGLQLWHLFKYAELTELVRLNDKLFIY